MGVATASPRTPAAPALQHPPDARHAYAHSQPAPSFAGSRARTGPSPPLALVHTPSHCPLLNTPHSSATPAPPQRHVHPQRPLIHDTRSSTTPAHPRRHVRRPLLRVAHWPSQRQPRICAMVKGTVTWCELHVGLQPTHSSLATAVSDIDG